MRLKLFLVFSLAFLFSCSSKLLLPFEEEQVCRKGIGYGYCGRLSDVYDDSVKNPRKYGIKEEKP